MLAEWVLDMQLNGRHNMVEDYVDQMQVVGIDAGIGVGIDEQLVDRHSFCNIYNIYIYISFSYELQYIKL